MKDCDRYNVSSLLSVVNYLQEENSNDTLYPLVKGLHYIQFEKKKTNIVNQKSSIAYFITSNRFLDDDDDDDDHLMVA